MNSIKTISQSLVKRYNIDWTKDLEFDHHLPLFIARKCSEEINMIFKGLDNLKLVHKSCHRHKTVVDNIGLLIGREIRTFCLNKKKVSDLNQFSITYIELTRIKIILELLYKYNIKLWNLNFEQYNTIPYEVKWGNTVLGKITLRMRHSEASAIIRLYNKLLTQINKELISIDKSKVEPFVIDKCNDIFENERLLKNIKKIANTYIGSDSLGSNNLKS